LTESISMEDPENTIGILRTLKRMGVCLSIDDFGTGYSNLNYLKRFPLDKLKLDQSFVRDLISDPDDLSISRAVIAMAHTLRLKVIAEGVEKEGQRLLLTRSGCDEMQGYLFSRPVPAADCEKYLREGKSLTVGNEQPYQRTLLLVSETESWRELAQQVSTDMALKILVAATTAEAFDVLATVEVGAVIYELQAATADGAEFLSRVKQMHPTIARLVVETSVAEHLEHAITERVLGASTSPASLSSELNKAFKAYESKPVGYRPITH
ncbi:MAG TPA: EAL domain-containing protein, partial [Rhodocyclaceae bacterium]|nr:EAL domain-containing protein [Rhodocyclaceae bacterium]